MLQKTLIDTTMEKELRSLNLRKDNLLQSCTQVYVRTTIRVVSTFFIKTLDTIRMHYLALKDIIAALAVGAITCTNRSGQGFRGSFFLISIPG